jgi:hypothetical protein
MSTKSLLKDINSQLQSHCLELVSNKQALHNKDKELATIKFQILKLQIRNEHLVAKSVEAKKAIKKA